MRTVISLLVGLAWAAVLLGGAFRPQAGAAAGGVRPMVGYTAPEVALTDVDGKPVTLREFRGKAVYLNFWASWCGPCRLEMPEIERLAGSLPPDSVLLTVNMTHQERSVEEVKAYLREGGYTFPVALDPKGAAADAYNVLSLPTSLFVNPDGVVTARISGPLAYSAMLDYLKAAGR